MSKQGKVMVTVSREELFDVLENRSCFYNLLCVFLMKDK